MSRWTTYEPDFYEEIVPLFNELVDDEEQTLLTCKCYGRGKVLNEVEVPRVPQLHFQIEKQRYAEKTRSGEDPKSRRLGRGRARVRKNIHHDDEISGVGQHQFSDEAHYPSVETHTVTLSQEPKKNTGGFGRPSFPVDTHNYNMEFSNVQATRRGFSVEDFISKSSYTQKKRKNKSSTGSTPLPSSTGDTDRCTSPENNEAVHVPMDSRGSEHTIDGYLLSKMLNIPCTAGEKIINTDGSVTSTGSLTGYSVSLSEKLDRFEDALVLPKKKEKRKKGTVASAKSSSVLNTADGWVLEGENVVEISDLPGDCDVSLLRDIIAAYGSILESDLISSGSTVSVRYQLDSSEAADWVVSNLHNADYLYAEHCVTCKRIC